MFVYGKFIQEEDAADAVRALMNNGFDVRYISALMGTDAGVSKVPVSVESGVRRGAVLGAAIGAAGGVLLATGPGLLAAGPLLAVLEGAIGGGAFGGVQGGILGLLFAETKVEFDQEELEKGTILIGVNADTRPDLAREVLTESGAARIETHDKPLGG
jgi:hypothetical protein